MVGLLTISCKTVSFNCHLQITIINTLGGILLQIDRIFNVKVLLHLLPRLLFSCHSILCVCDILLCNIVNGINSNNRSSNIKNLNLHNYNSTKNTNIEKTSFSSSSWINSRVVLLLLLVTPLVLSRRVSSF